MPQFSNISITDEGRFKGVDRGTQFSAGFPLFIIHAAWDKGVDFEDLADGFGAGQGTMGGDWSGIRDSSLGAVEKMLQRSLNKLFGGSK